MKPISFSIPDTGEETIRIQRDEGKNFYPNFHAHRETQISWIIKGSGNLLVEHNIIPFEENSIFILGPGMPHVFKTDPNRNQYVKSLGMYFDPFSKMSALFQLPEINSLKGLLERFKSGGTLDFEIKKEFSEYLLRLENSRNIDRFKLFLDSLNFLSQNSVHIKPINVLSLKSISGNIDERIQTVIEFSFNQYPKTIKIEDVASLINMSVHSFCRFFKMNTGKSYVNYLNELRIAQASQLLRSSRSPISEIAFRCGFNYVQHFNRTFKSLKGLTPKEFRKLSF